MNRITLSFFSVVSLLVLAAAFQAATVTNARAEVDPSQVYLPKALKPQLSLDGKSLSMGLPLRAVVDDPNPAGPLRKIPAPEGLTTDPAAATSTFTITYKPNGSTDPWSEACYTFPAAAKAAFDAAANIWANILTSNVPITISACWGSLSGSTLGYSGGGPLHRNFTGATRTATWYTGSLANALHGSDLSAANYDMHITYNQNFSWYYGTDGNPPAGQHDLMSVVLHEIGHGLNFSGSMDYSSGVGSYGYSASPLNPNIYDVFIRDNSGTLLTSYTNNSVPLGSALTSGSLWFHGTNAMAANGGNRVRMYAPSTWADGSSYSHLDYNTFNGTSNQLMVYAISAGEAIHDPGVVTRGLLEDLGWSDSGAVVPPSGSFFWPKFLPAITIKGGGAPAGPPIWGAGSQVCCTNSSTTFSLTSSGVTKRSSLASCSSTPTWEGWVTTTPGSKTFSWTLSSPTCGTYNGGFSYPLVDGRSYFFQIELDGSDLVVYVYIATTSETASEAAESAGVITSSMELIDTIRLDVPQGAFSDRSVEVAD